MKQAIVVSKTQAALQRRLGRLSMLVDLVAEDYDANNELITAMKKEISLIKEISMRLVEIPRPHNGGDDHPESERPPVTSRRP